MTSAGNMPNVRNPYILPLDKIPLTTYGDMISYKDLMVKGASILKTSGPLGPFQNARFRWLYASNNAFFLGMGNQNVVRAWLAFKLTDSEFALGMVMFAFAVPMLVMAPIGGVFTDRMDRRRLITMGQAFVLCGETVILTLLFFDMLTFWHLLTLAALMGSVFPFIMPARNAIIVNIVGKRHLSQAMGLHMAGFNTSRIVGPAAAGFFIEAIGVTHTYIIGVALYVVCLLCLKPVSASPPSPGETGKSVKESILEGVRYMRGNQLVRLLLLFGLVPMFLAMPFQNLLVVFAEKIWVVGPLGFGLLNAAGGLGGVLGAIWVARHGSSHKRLRRMMVSMLFFGISLFCFAISPYFSLGLVLVFIANLFANIFSTMNNTAIHLLIPDQVRGRISSFLMMSFSLPLLGTLPVAALAQAFGAPFAVALTAVLSLIIAILFYVASPALRQMDASVSYALKEDLVKCPIKTQASGDDRPLPHK
jgi:MFS family permease